ncbi:MAG TPA: hypothetical protein PL196_03990 [Burkholderiaceae bacterium]|nr:hypothetical protein [Burkholderiaceae bacterium]
MPRPHLAFVAFAACLACAQASAAESYVIYDDFATATLDPARWSAVEYTRKVESNAMRLVQRDWGLTNSDAGSQTRYWNENVSRAGPITQFRATLRVNALDMTACPANGTTTSVRARILGTFFNTGTRVAGNGVGDVFGQITLSRASNSADAPGVLRVDALVAMCTSPDCLSSTFIGSSVPMGTVNVGANILVQMEWDRANKRFLFSRDKGAPTAVAYTQDDSADPAVPFKYVGTRTTVASCASGPRAFAFIDTRVDNVAVNASAKP